MRKEEMILEHDADRSSFGRDERVGAGIVEDGAIDDDVAAVDRDESGESAQQRRLARPVRAENRQHLARLDTDLHVELERCRAALRSTCRGSCQCCPSAAEPPVAQPDEDGERHRDHQQADDQCLLRIGLECEVRRQWQRLGGARLSLKVNGPR